MHDKTTNTRPKKGYHARNLILYVEALKKSHLESQVTLSPPKDHHFTPLHTQAHSNTSTTLPHTSPLLIHPLIESLGCQTTPILATNPKENRGKKEKKRGKFGETLHHPLSPKDLLLALHCANLAT